MSIRKGEKRGAMLDILYVLRSTCAVNFRNPFDRGLKPSKKTVACSVGGGGGGKGGGIMPDIIWPKSGRRRDYKTALLSWESYRLD